MARKSSNGYERERRVVAQEAARIIVNHGIRDYRVAKLKAAERLGMSSRGSLPGNAEIEQAVAEHHQIFGGDGHADLLDRLRRTALRAMALLDAFSPRLVGPVLTGTADDNSAINLHVFSDSAEAVPAILATRDIASRAYERRLRTRRGQFDTYAGFEFRFDQAHVQATVFPVDGIRQAPLSPVDGKPMERADTRRVSELIRV
jgi:hypothetical protein